MPVKTKIMKLLDTRRDVTYMRMLVTEGDFAKVRHAIKQGESVSILDANPDEASNVGEITIGSETLRNTIQFIER